MNEKCIDSRPDGRHSPDSGNRGGKQGRGNQPPHRRYGPDTEIQYRPRNPRELAKPSRILSKREADAEFQYRPRIVDTDMIADSVFADAISETSKTVFSKWCFSYSSPRRATEESPFRGTKERLKTPAFFSILALPRLLQNETTKTR